MTALGVVSLTPSLMGMLSRARGVFVSTLTVFVRRSCVLLGLFVLADRVMMFCLMVMMRGGMVVSGGLVMMFTRRMCWRLCHLRSSI